MLVHELQYVVLLLLVNLLRENHLLVVLYRIVDALGGVLCLLYFLEYLLDFLFHIINVNVADNYNTLQVGAVPLLIVVAQSLMREVVDNLHCTYRKAFAVAAAREDVSKHAFLHTHHRSVAAAPLLMDYTTLLVNLFACECKAVGPVTENPET